MPEETDLYTPRRGRQDARVNLLQETALDLATKLRKGELSAVELTKASFAKIAEKDRQISAFLELDERRALAAAESADRALRRGGRLPRLLGVPTAIKDHEHMRWMHTRAGSRALTWVVSPIDSELAARCRKGGMVLLGKVSTSELTILPFIDVPLHPPTRNPLDLGRYSGGSSGGSAAAVAGGMIPIAPGSDGAGSIRIPAAFCGLVGFKPGRGVLFHEHEITDPSEISAVGPIARDVRDAAALLDVLAGGAYASADGDPTHGEPGSFLAAVAEKPRRLKIKLSVRSPLATVLPEIEEAVRGAAKKLASLGHHVDDGPPIVGSVEEFMPLMARMVASVPLPPFTDRFLQPTTRWMREQGRGLSRSVVLEAQKQLGKRVLEWFGDADVWILPTSPNFAPEVGQFARLDGEATFRAVVPIGAFTAGFNVSGQPAVSIPMPTRGRLPAGIQLVGRPGGDRLILSLAAELEAALKSL